MERNVQNYFTLLKKQKAKPFFIIETEKTSRHLSKIIFTQFD